MCRGNLFRVTFSSGSPFWVWDSKWKINKLQTSKQTCGCLWGVRLAVTGASLITLPFSSPPLAWVSCSVYWNIRGFNRHLLNWTTNQSAGTMAVLLYIGSSCSPQRKFWFESLRKKGKGGGNGTVSVWSPTMTGTVKCCMYPCTILCNPTNTPWSRHYSHFTDETAVTLKVKIICLRTHWVSKLGFEHQMTLVISRQHRYHPAEASLLRATQYQYLAQIKISHAAKQKRVDIFISKKKKKWSQVLEHA